MPRCNHTSWLSFHDGNPILLRQTSALSDIVTSLQTPAEAWPSLVGLIDEASSKTLVDQVLPKSGRYTGHGEVRGISLQLDADTAFSDRPVLIARSNFATFSKLTPEPDIALCHSQIIREVQRPPGTLDDLVHDLYYELLYPFVDVVCLFASELNGMNSVLHHLEAWCKHVQRVPLTPRPRILVVAAPKERRSPASVLADLLSHLQQRLSQVNADLATSITVYVKHGSRQSLRNRVRWETDLSRTIRANKSTLFNALHYEQMFRRACDHFVLSSQHGVFDILAAARLHRPVSASLGVHLADIFARVKTCSDMTDFAAPYIAECLLLDNYTTDVHAFDPQEVFAELYRDICVANVQNMTLEGSKSAVTYVRTGIVRLVEREFVSRANPFRSRDKNRFRVLDSFQRWVSKIKTYRSCLACLQRRPEYKYPCNHMICEGCCTELGRREDRDRDLFVFTNCPFCKLTCNIHIRVKPATAGVRLLSIDGGGVRAVIPIQFLRALEQALGLGIPVQEHFDLSYGTSSGSMVIIALYGLGMSLDGVYDLFKRLSERIFRGRKGFGIGFAAAIHAFVSSYYHGHYPSADIESVLRELLGDSTMLDYTYMMSIGARIGFPLVNVYTLQTCIVTSYNGVGRVMKPETAYKILGSESPSGEILVRDAIQGAAAAPYYFAPKTIVGHGTFCDGGLSNHNPGTLMLQEQQRLDPSFRRPDQLVSVGTGLCTLNRAAVEPTLATRVNPLYQTYQHYMQYNFNGSQQFRNMRDMVKVSVSAEDDNVDQYVRRFDLPVDGPLADLADPAAIDPLGDAAWQYFSSSDKVHDLARSIIASMFYFELRRMPLYESGRYTCYGRILCRIPVTNPGFASLMHRLDTLSATFSVQGRTLSSRKPRFDRLGNFSKPVCLYVFGFDECVHARVDFANTHGYHLSASPISIASLIKLQKLDWPSTCIDNTAGRGPVKRRQPQKTQARKRQRRVFSASNE